MYNVIHCIAKRRILYVFLLCTAIAIPAAYAIFPVWTDEPYSPDDGCSDTTQYCALPVILEVTDGGAVGTIDVTLTSSVDPVGTTVTLVETGVGTGVFQSTKIALMNGNNIFSTSDTITATIVATTDPVPDNNLQQTITNVRVTSELDTTGFLPTFTETGLATNTYTAKIRFGAATNAATNTIAATAGTIFSIHDPLTGASNGIISPIPAGKGAIKVEEGGTITARYQGDETDTALGVYPGPGRGGGGVIPPSLVVDAIAPAASDRSGGNGCIGDCNPPTLGVDESYNRLVSSGFSYNGYPVDVQLYYTPYPLITVNVGQKNTAILKIYDDSGINHIEHVGLAFGLGTGQIFSQSEASIEISLENSEIVNLSTVDPENVLDNIIVRKGIDRCSSFITQSCLVLEIDHMFRAPLEFNMVSTIAWDKNRNEVQNYYNHGVEIIGNSLNPPKQHVGIYHGQQLILTETEKNKAIDSEGRTWTFDNVWNIDYFPRKKIDVAMTSHGYDRNHEEFSTYKNTQIDLAQLTLAKILNGKKMYDEPEESRTIYLNYTTRQENQELQDAITKELLKAQETWNILVNGGSWE